MSAIIMRVRCNMKTLGFWFLGAALTICMHVAHGEGFMGITAKSRLHDLKTQFPNATLTELKPVWLQPHQRLIQVSGIGINGTLAVKLEHEVEATRLLYVELAKRQADNSIESWQAELLQGLPEKVTNLQRNPPSDPWEVKDIRWEPPTPVPLRSALARYGKPDSNKSDEQFRRVVEWSSKGVTAYVDQREVISVFIYTFTLQDYLCANLPDACKNIDREDPKSKPMRGSKR